jgi:hypothetical protein
MANQWNALNLFWTSFSKAKELVELYRKADYVEEFGFTFIGLKLDEGTWREQVELKISALSWPYLFGSREVVAGALQHGFQLAIQELRGVADPLMLQRI